MIYGIPDDADYGRIWILLRLRVDSDRKKGGDHASMSDVHERLLSEHDTAAHQRGAPCASCAKPWPCPTVSSIVNSLD